MYYVKFFTLYTATYTNSDGIRDSTAAPIAVTGHYANSVIHIVGYSWQ